ncbi:hypothetical protein [Streptomyces sp. NPDC003832]
MLSLHAAIVLLMAAAVGALTGVLTLYSTDEPATALLAGLASFGACVPALHKLIGR